MEPARNERFWCHNCNKEVNVQDFLCSVCGDGFIEPITVDQEHLNYRIVQDQPQQPLPQPMNEIPGFLPFQNLMRGVHNARIHINQGPMRGGQGNGPRVFSFQFGGPVGANFGGNQGGLLGFEAIKYVTFHLSVFYYYYYYY